MYTPEHIEKIGNTIVFLVTNMKKVSKTKLLKLLYILDEISIKKSGLPFLNLEYKVWKFGPVANDIFVELSSSPSFLKDYIERKIDNDNTYVEAKRTFSDDEFSKNEIELMNLVVDKFKDATADELISFTHRQNSPWYNAAKNNLVLELLETEQISSTDIKINMLELVEHDERKKNIYLDYIESYSHNTLSGN
jgi:uncharacterized phage-associated protein